MNDLLVAILSPAVSVAVITSIFEIVKWALERRAKKADDTKETLKQRFLELEKMVKNNAEITSKFNEVEIAGLRSLLYTAIKDRAKRALAAGYISAEDLEDLNRMHELYHGPLEGNGFLTALMIRVNALPVHD